MKKIFLSIIIITSSVVPVFGLESNDQPNSKDLENRLITIIQNDTDRMKREMDFGVANVLLHREVVDTLDEIWSGKKISNTRKNQLIRKIQGHIVKYKEFNDYRDPSYGTKYIAYYGMLGDIYSTISGKKTVSKNYYLKARKLYLGYWNLWEILTLEERFSYTGLSLLVDLVKINEDLGDMSGAEYYNELLLDNIILATDKYGDYDSSIQTYWEIYNVYSERIEALKTE